MDIALELQKFRLDHKKYERKLKQLMQHKRRWPGSATGGVRRAVQKSPRSGRSVADQGLESLARRKPSLDE